MSRVWPSPLINTTLSATSKIGFSSRSGWNGKLFSFFLVLCFCILPAVWLTPPALAQSSEDIGELFATEPTAHGPALLAGTGMSVGNGSKLAAGKSVATLRLSRGGELRLCPNSSLTVGAVQSNVPQSSREFAFSMDTGSVEFDYPLNDVADTLVTPDFRFLMAGPGAFHFALGVTNRGDTCVRSMRGNSAGIIVSEMLGNGVYQIKPDETLIFLGGKLSGRAPLESPCGCPAPPPVVLTKKSEAPQPQPNQPLHASLGAVPSPLPGDATDSNATAGKPDTLHMEVEAPMVFLASQPEPSYTVARIRFSSLPNTHLMQETGKPLVLRPNQRKALAQSAEKRGFLGRIRGFLAGIFH